MRPVEAVTTERFREAMRRAIELAGAHRTHPNPRVGAVVVDANGRILAEGAHDGVGSPHAETVALDRAGAAARGSTVVVTLEPCTHVGHTPPCTDALIEAGVSRVVVGAIDPDPRVAGGGVRRLREAGIEVIDGVLADECEALDPAYFHHRRTGRPRVTLKAAATLDGQVAALDGTSQWITSPEARADAHRLRAEADAVLIGAGTLLADDPRLTVRLPGYTGPQPVPVVVAGRRPLPPGARLWERPALIVATDLRDEAETVVVPPGPDGRPDLGVALRALGERGLLDILVEGGPTLARSLWDRRLVDRGVFYLGATVAGGGGRPIFDGGFDTLAAARTVQIDQVRRLGPDLRVEWVVVPDAEGSPAEAGRGAG